MASGKSSLNSYFGIQAGETRDLGRRVSDAGAPNRTTTTHAAQLGSLTTIPVLLAIGVVLWFALHE